METTVISFGFKHGLPLEADMVLDARFLPNPHYEPSLRPLTGKDPAVRNFLVAHESFIEFLVRAEGWLRWSWPLVKEEARAYHTLAIGCTGGRHRSVALVELLRERLAPEIPALVVLHRELNS